MSELVNKKTGEITQFDPEKTKLHQAKADALIDYAGDIKDWPLLREAIDIKVDEVLQFCSWWDANVAEKGRPKNSAERRYFSQSEAEKKTKIKHQQVSRWKKKVVKDHVHYRQSLFDQTYAKAMEQGSPFAKDWSGEESWYTPEKYIEAAREVLGAIDLDPATSELAQKIVRANKYYVDDGEGGGLKKSWAGRVWMNPPYKRPKLFIDKLLEHYSAGDITSAILLTNNNTDTTWWHDAAQIASAVCFTIGRISFYNEHGEASSPTNGQTFFYFGNDTEEFEKRFLEFGLILSGAT